MRPTPPKIMWQNYLEARRRGALHGEGLDGLKLTVERLQAERAAKDTRIGELEATLAGSVPLPPNAVKLPVARGSGGNAPKSGGNPPAKPEPREAPVGVMAPCV
jgi:hypothetical protein